jgi:hypothetical protein
MRYMLLMDYADAPGVPPLNEWAPEDARARGEAMMAIHRELMTSGELVGAEGRPEAAKIVTHDGVGGPVVTDGPFAEPKELLAGYWLVDVQSEERAVEIAARTSAAPGLDWRPGPGGAPLRTTHSPRSSGRPSPSTPPATTGSS